MRRRSWPRPRCPACCPYGNLVTNRHQVLGRSRSFYPGGKPTEKDASTTRHDARWQTTSYCAFPRFHSIHSTSFAFAPPALLSLLSHSWRSTHLPSAPPSFASPTVQRFLFSACTVWCNEFAQVAWLQSKSCSSLDERGGKRIKRPMVNSASRATRKNRPRNMNKFLVRELRRVCSKLSSQRVILEETGGTSSPEAWIVPFLRDRR